MTQMRTLYGYASCTYIFCPCVLPGGPRREPKDLGWLEFCPVEHRPTVHVFSASHVLSPYRYLDNYYRSQKGWLSAVKQQHCVFALEIIDSRNINEPLAKFALNPFPIHHPDSDMGIIHLKDETAALKQMEKLGVQVLRLRSNENQFDRNEAVSFDGFEIALPDGSDKGNVLAETSTAIKQQGQANVKGKKTESTKFDWDDDDDDDDEDNLLSEQDMRDDVRCFIPYSVTGNLIFNSAERVLARTDVPLPDGLCGGPVIDSEGRVSGIVEGIVPKDYADERLAGAAAFIPATAIAQFLTAAEMRMLEQIIPESLFTKVTQIKSGNYNDDKKALSLENMSPDQQMQEMMHHIQRSMNPEDADNFMQEVQREKEQVMRHLSEEKTEDVYEAIKMVRKQSEEISQMAKEETIRRSKAEIAGGGVEQAVVSDEKNLRNKTRIKIPPRQGGSGRHRRKRLVPEE